LDEIGMGDPMFTAELIDIMLEDGASKIRNIRSACEAGKHEEVGKLAHSLKGAALNIGAGSLASLCANIDDTVRKLGQLSSAEQVDCVEIEFNVVASELSSIKRELTA
jgi:HPt (histidine-containing phosphotransfer) domain-containing protein